MSTFLSFPTHSCDVHERSQEDMWEIKLKVDWIMSDYAKLEECHEKSLVAW